MTELEIGAIVRSSAGRDKKRIFVVVDIDHENPLCPAVIANGELRKLNHRKHKNPSHLIYVGNVTDEEKKLLLEGAENEQILTICKKYDLI